MCRHRGRHRQRQTFHTQRHAGAESNVSVRRINKATAKTAVEAAIARKHQCQAQATEAAAAVPASMKSLAAAEKSVLDLGIEVSVAQANLELARKKVELFVSHAKVAYNELRDLAPKPVSADEGSAEECSVLSSASSHVFGLPWATSVSVAIIVFVVWSSFLFQMLRVMNLVVRSFRCVSLLFSTLPDISLDQMNTNLLNTCLWLRLSPCLSVYLSVSFRFSVTICMHTSLLHSAHLSTTPVTDALTHSRWLKSCHKTELHLSW